MLAFITILLVLMVIYLLTSVREGFDTFSKPPDHKVNIPFNVIPAAIPPPPARNMDELSAKPADIPGSLPIAPYEQIANASPLPYQDPTLIKAKRQEIINTLEDLKGFLAFEAQEISEQSDPAIQLPLTNARADFKRLQDEVNLLQRNPGLQPDMTEMNLAEIQANLAYLQRTVRLIGAAGPLQGPIYEFTRNVAVEGFEDAPVSSGAIATPEDLNDFVAKLSAEIIRLSASGTTDPVINARVVALTNIKQNVQTILAQVKSGALLSVQIPIMKKDINNALPILGNPSEPLPQIIQSLRLPPGLGNLLPSNLQKDPDVTRQINKLVDKYADDIIKGTSASVTVRYTSPRETELMDAEADIAKALFREKKSTITKTGFPSMEDLDGVSGNDSYVKDASTISDPYAQRPVDAGRGPAKFDWKQRAKEIEAQVKLRGLKAPDFGIMPENAKVSEDFSWRGYAKMICTRLQATMDPALPETCGCPPMDWKGWHVPTY